MKDVQNTPDTRGIAIEQVDVCDLSYPITVLDRENQKQQGAAKISLSVSLPHNFKFQAFTFQVSSSTFPLHDTLPTDELYRLR
jgi:hypothetical protein